MSKVLTVFGATGVQGGSVVSTVLAHPTLSKIFAVRAVTRDPSKPKAQKLASTDVDVVKADMDDAASVSAAVEGSYAVFSVTNYWEKASKTVEVAQGKTIADACKAQGVKHLIWSALPHVQTMTNGSLSHVPHFDGKAEVSKYIESIKGSDMVATYFMPGFYMSNVRPNINPGQDGVPTLTEPWHVKDTHVPLFAANDDTGKFVAGILASDPKTVNGRYVNAVSEWRTPAQMVETVSEVAGRKVNFMQVPEDVFQGFLPPQIAKELTENMVLVRDYTYYGKDSEKEQSKHDEILGDMKTTSWKDYVAKNGPWQW